MTMSVGMYLVMSIAILLTAGLIAGAVLLERRGHPGRAVRGGPWVAAIMLLVMGAIANVMLAGGQDYWDSPWLWSGAPLLVVVGVLAYIRPRWAGALLLVLAFALPAAGIAVASSTGVAHAADGFTRGALLLYTIPGLITGGLLLLAATPPDSAGFSGSQPPATAAHG
jgi:hypothetical protein